MKYLLNRECVLFHPVLDQENNHTTIVCIPKDGSFHKISQLGYWCLKLLDNYPRSKQDQMIKYVAMIIHTSPWQIENKVRSFITKMVNMKVISEENE